MRWGTYKHHGAVRPTAIDALSTVHRGSFNVLVAGQHVELSQSSISCVRLLYLWVLFICWALRKVAVTAGCFASAVAICVDCFYLIASVCNCCYGWIYLRDSQKRNRKQKLKLSKRACWQKVNEGIPVARWRRQAYGNRDKSRKDLATTPRSLTLCAELL